MSQRQDAPAAADHSARPARSSSAKSTRGAAAARRSAARRRAAQRRQPRLSRLLAWLLSAVLGSAGLAYAQVPANALPSGGKVMVGSGQLQQSANLLIVNQGSARLGMDWQSFNIGSGATVEFRQPGPESIALNRVVGHSGSEIYGKLRANGQVFLTNPNGVLFAPGAQVDVGGLVASTLDLSQQDFADGRFVFGGSGSGAVVNQGNLRASAGGYLALFGNRVDNQGSIAVDSGAVVLASGRAATVSISGSGLISAVVTPGEAGSVSNSGSILADGGVVRMSAASAEGIAASLVNNSGLIRANTIVERAGEIWITGDNVATSGQIVASAPGGGDAGRVMLMGDMQRGTVQLAGSIDASAPSGKGGFVETSAATVNVADGARVSTTAPGGTAGLWLIDPNDYTVAASGGNITGATLSANLGGGNVAIQTSQQGTAGGNGDIFVNDAVTWAGSRLTLIAERNITINAPITGATVVGAGAASLSLEYGQAALAAGNTSTYTVGAPVTLPAGSNFLTKLGSNGTTNTFTVVVDAAGLQGIDALSRTGNYALGANIDLSSISNFNPIGNETTSAVSAFNSFGGRFDGLGHTVSGLTTSGYASTGLFATTTGADIRNLTLSGGSVAGTGYAGAVAGLASGATNLTQVRSTVAVSSSGVSQAVGGLVGQSGTGTIANSSVGSVGNPVAISGGNYTGGLVGNASTTTFTGSSAAITLTGAAAYMGGLAGLSAGAVSGSSATGTAQASGNAWLGGLIGNTTGSVSNSTADVAVTATNAGSDVGGLIGASTAGVSGSTAAGAVTGGLRAGGLVALYSGNGTISASSASGNVSSTVASSDVGGLVGNLSGATSVTGSSATGNVSGPYTVGGLIGYALGTGTLSSSSATGSVTSSTAAAWIGGLVGRYGLSTSMTGAISASGVVSGGSSAGGVIGYYNSSAPISGLTHGSASVTGQDWVGGLIGYSEASSITGSSSASNVTSTGVSYAAGGLVGRTASGITNSSASGNVSAAGDAGGLVGRAEGTGALTDVSASGSVTSTGPNSRVGGLGGYVTSGAVLRGTASGAVSGGGYTGGLIGSYNDPGGIQSSSTAVTSTVNGRDQVGGLVGSAAGSGGYTDVIARGNVSGGNYAGGLIGYMSSAGAVTSALAGGNVTTSGSYGGGLIGYWSSSGNITDSQATGNVLSTATSASVGGLIGYGNGGGGVHRSINNTRATGNVTGGQYAGGLVGLLYYTSIDRGTAFGKVTTTGDSTAYGGGLVGYYYNFFAGSQIANSSATGAVFVDSANSYVGGLVGEFNSGSITASTASGNVTGRDSLNSNNSEYSGGLVGVFNGAAISDSAATGNVVGSYYSGGLAGYYSGTAPLSNSSAIGSVSGTQYVGGLVGYHTNAGITNGFASGQVTSTSTGGYTGGLAGYAYTYAANNLSGINDSRATGNVSGGTYVGGLIGRFDDYTSATNSVGGVSNSNASGNVSGTAAVGGLVGYQYSPYGANTLNISNSRARGDVQGTGAVGGLVGDFNGYAGIRDSHASGNVVGLSGTGSKQLGGLVGQFNSFSDTTGNGVLARSYATGSVRLDSTASLSTFTNVWAGGLVGYLSGSGTTAVALSDSYATGAVTLSNSVGRLRAGGLVGSAQRSLTRSYATGAVSATGGNSRVAGGLAGERATAAVVTSSFWATDTTGQASSFGGTASTLATLKSDATFPADWDMATTPGTTQVWRIYDGLGTPLLRSFLTPLSLSLANITKVYDGTTSLGSGVISVGGTTVANPERILVSGVSANAGSYTLGAANVYSVHNGYDLTVTGSANLTIGQRPLTLAGLAANKVYDGTAAASVAANPQFGGLVTGEDLVFQPGTGFAMQFATKTAGTGKTVNITGGYTLTDGSVGRAANYVVPTATTTTADITPATLSAGSFSATNRAYDGTIAVAVSATAATLTGVMPGDNVGVDLSSVTSGTVANKNAGTAKPVTVNGIVLSGADVGNYVLAGASTTTVDITPKVLTVNGINATDRAYNRALGVNLTTAAVSLSGLESGDQVQSRLSGLSGNLADKNVGNGKAVTVSGLALRGPDAANYAPQAGAVNVNITPRAVNMLVTTTGQTNRIYDGTTTASVALYNDWTFNTNNLWAGDDVTVATTSTGYADKNVAYNTAGAVTSKTITVSGFSLSGTDAFNFALQNTSATATGTISPKPLTVSGVSAANRVYDGTRDVVVTISGATVDTTAVIPGDTVGVATPGSGTVTGQVANKNVGNAKAVTVPGLALTGGDAGNYSITSGTGGGVTANITRKDVTATYTAANKVYDFGTGAVVISSTTDFVSTDTVLFASNQPGCQTFSGCGYGYFTEAGRQANGSFVQRRHVGTALPVVVQSNSLYSTDAANYNLLNPTGATTADITPKPVNLAYTGVSRAYDGTTDATVSLNINASGVYSQDTVTSAQTAAYTGATAKDVAYNSSGGVISKPISITNISLSGIHAGNYAVGNTSATATGIMTAKPITVSGISATDRAYDGTTTVAVTAGTVTSAGFLPADTVAVALPVGGLNSGTIANKNVGLNKPVTVTGLTLTGADAGNYSIDSTGSGITVNISQLGLTPTYSGVSRVYSGGISATVTSTTAGIASGDTLTFNQQAIYTGSGARDAGIGKPISVSNITLSGSSAANYTLASTTATTTGDITPKPVTASYTGASRVYNGVADISAAVVGNSLQFVAGDSVGLSETARFTGDGSAGANKPVSISNIAITGPQAANYSLLATTGTTTATITPRPLGVTGITATNRVYDGTTTVAVNVAGATVDTTTVVSGDVVSVTLPGSGISTGTLADRHVGNNRPVAITGLNVAGTSAANYTLVGASGLTVNITPKSLTAVYGGVNKVYDGNADAVVTGNSGDIFAVDAASLGFSAQGVFTAGKNVGTGKAVNVISAFLTGASRDDYLLANPTGSTTADITPRALTANYSGGSKVYDGTAVAVVSGTLANRVTGDSVAATQSAEFTGTGARNVGSSKPISVTGITLTGADAGNYTLGNTTDTTTGAITPRPITVSGLTNVVATDRVYDGTRVVDVTVPVGVTLVPNSSDIISGDAVTIDVPVSGVTTGTVLTKNAGNGKAVSVDGLTLSGGEAANYSIAGTAGITVNIARKPLTAVYSGVNKVYDGLTAVNVTGTSGDVVAGDSLAIGGIGQLTGTDAKNVGTAKAVNVTSAGLSSTDAANYTLTNTSGTTTVDVTVRPVTPTYVGGSRVYDRTAGAPVTSTVSNFVVGDSISLSQSAVFAGSFASAKNVGTGKAIQVTGITLAGGDAVNYSLTTTNASATGSITPKSITLTGLTGVSAANRVYDGTRAIDVTITSSGTIGVNTADIEPGDTVGVLAPSSGLTTGTLADKNAGNNRPLVVDGLTLTGADAGNYTVSAANGITVNIARKPLTAVYTGVNRVYDGSALAAVVGSSADLVAGDSLTINGSGTFTAGKNAGTAKAIAVTAGGLGSTDAANYTLLNTTGTATADIATKVVSAVYLGGTRVYDGTTAAPVTGTLSGMVAGDAVALAQGAVFTGVGAKNVGAGKAVDVSGITLSGADAVNYSLSANLGTTTASITPRPLGLLGLTGVSAADRVYNGSSVVDVTVSTTGTVTPNPVDLIAGDVVTIATPPTGLTTGTMANKNVGTNKPVAVAGLTLGGADAGNYSVASTSGVSVNITPKSLTASFAGVNRTYDGTTTAAAIGTSSDIVAGDSVLINAAGVFSGSGARNAGLAKPVDLLSAALTGTDAINYSLVNATGSTSADITPRTVVATYAAGTRVYDGTDTAPVSRNVSGLLAGDAVSLAETAVFTGVGAKNVGTGKAVQVSAITLSGADAINYALLGTSASTAGTITPRPLNVTGLSGISAIDRSYDGTRNVQVNVAGALGSASGDVIAGDIVTVNVPGTGVTGGTMADKNVGQNKAVVLSGLFLSGADAPNYVIAGTAGLTVSITPRTLNAGYAGVNRVYDGTTAATVLGSSGDIVPGDAVSISAVGAFSGSGARNAGTGKPIDVQSTNLSGADQANYQLANTTGSASADITPLTVTPTYTGGSRVYDGTTSAPVTRTATAFLTGDTVALSETAVFTGAGARNVGSGKGIDVTGITLSGADAGNYALVGTSASTVGSITVRPLNVTGLSGITAVDREYNGSRAVQVNLPSNLGSAGVDVIAGDIVTVNVVTGGLGGGTMVDKNAGQNKSVALNGLFLGGSDAPNYVIAGTAGVTVNIAPRAVTLLGVGTVDRVYDGTTAVAISTSGGSISGAVTGDDLQLPTTGVTGSMADKHVGQAKPVVVNGLTLSGADLANYTVAGGGGLTVNIARRNLTPSVTVADKTYDGNTGATITLLDDRVAGDALTLIHGGASFADRNAGNGIAVTVSSLAASGADAANYQLGTTTLSALASINRAPLAVTSVLTKVYGDTLVLSGTEFSAIGLVAGETLGQVTLSSAGTAATADASATPYPVSVGNASGGTFNALNYDLTYRDGQLGVAPRPLTVAVNSLLRFEGERNPDGSFGLSTNAGGLVNGDVLTAGQAAVAPAGSDNALGVSVFSLLPANVSFASGTAANYAVSYSPGRLVVLPRPPLVGESNAGAEGGNTGQVGIGETEEIKAAKSRAEEELRRVAVLTGSGPTVPAGRGRQPAPVGEAPTPSQLGMLLSGDGQRITLPELYKLPLITLDPLLRRLMQADGAR